MPIYLYECENGHRTEVNQSIMAEPLARCPAFSECDARCWRIPNFRGSFDLKGPGFFRNDYPKEQR